MSRKKAFCAQYGHTTKILGDYPDALVEVCLDCGSDLIYKKAPDGSMDNGRYYTEHLKDFAQPTGKTAGIYAKFYGKPKPDTKADEDKFWEDRDAQRLEDWERGMKATDNAHFVKKVKNIVKKDK